jgi:hypothetical protein
MPIITERSYQSVSSGAPRTLPGGATGHLVS